MDNKFTFTPSNPKQILDPNALRFIIPGEPIDINGCTFQTEETAKQTETIIIQ